MRLFLANLKSQMVLFFATGFYFSFSYFDTFLHCKFAKVPKIPQNFRALRAGFYFSQISNLKSPLTGFIFRKFSNLKFHTGVLKRYVPIRPYLFFFEKKLRIDRSQRSGGSSDRYIRLLWKSRSLELSEKKYEKHLLPFST